MLKQISIFLFLLNSLNASSIEPTIFNCITKNNKEIELIDNGKTIQYSFGKKEKPELLLNLKRNEVKTYQWNGIGRYINYSVEFKNNNILYVVFSEFDRNEGKQYSGINVLKNNKIIASIECKKININHLEGVNLLPVIED